LAEVRQRFPEIVYSVSATTRKPRPGEVDGVDYFFVDDSTFDQLIATDSLLEWAEYTETRYGTPRQAVEQAVGNGQTVYLEIDLAGARQVRQSFPEALQVFIAPPSWKELRRRLRHRGAETEEEMDSRLRVARVELAAACEFDHVIINDDLQRAADELVELSGLAKGKSSEQSV